MMGALDYWYRIPINGIYLSIVVMSALASWHLLTRLVVPAFKNKNFRLGPSLIGVALIVTMSSHWWENVVFGLGRWYRDLSFLLTDPAYAFFDKVLILVGAVLTMAALDRAENGELHLGKWAVIAAGLWAVGAAAALIYWWLGIGFAAP